MNNTATTKPNEVLERGGSFVKHTVIQTGFSETDLTFISDSTLNLKDQEPFASQMKVTQIEDGIEIGVTKKVASGETSVWYFLNKEEIDTLIDYLRAIMPGVRNLYEEDSGNKSSKQEEHRIHVLSA